MEAAGVEFELAGFGNHLMVTDFWANLCSINRLASTAVSTQVPFNPLISTVFLEK
jgi:hypothetical protein